MKLKDIMTTDVMVVSPETPIRDVALKMEQANIGALPVCDGNRILGFITDRDICLKVVGRGLTPEEAKVSEIMTSPVVWCYEDCEVDEAARLMETRQIRRLVVINRDKKLVGVVALGDVATRANQKIAGEALEKISEPQHPIH